MVRLYGDPVRDVIDVRRRPPDDLADPAAGSAGSAAAAPEQFLWRGRLYLVRGVLAHWMEIGAWWRARSPDGLPTRIDDSGCEVWRVEAGAGRGASVGVFDLVFDEAAARWTLVRALD